MFSINDLRIHNKIVVGCFSCPSLITICNDQYCERTGTVFDGNFTLADCPLPPAISEHNKNSEVTYEERLMLTAMATCETYNKNLMMRCDNESKSF